MAFDVGGSGGKYKVRPSMNVTPLVDVVLVLLIIFMVLVPSTLKQLQASVPRKVESTAQDQNTQLVVKIGARGELALNEQPVTREALPTELRRRLTADGQKPVFFEVADGVAYGEVVTIMDLVKGAGWRRLAIVTRDGPP
jgi:biopolymer transport protein TolR